MHSSFDAWKEDFHFSEDLAALEQELSMDLPEDLSDPALFAKPRPSAGNKSTVLPDDITDFSSIEPGSMPAEGTAEWNQMVELVSSRILQRVGAVVKQKEASLKEFQAELQSLQQDNQILAAQIRDLLAENDRLQLELECRDVQLSRFRKILGRWYYFK